MGYPAMGETLARARALAEQLDRPEYLVPVLYGQWQYHLVRAEYKPALSVAEQLEKTGETRNDITTQLMAYHAIGLVRLCRGELVAARAVMEHCRDLADPTRRTFSVGMNEDPYIATLANLAETLTRLGYLDQARLQIRGALSEARRLNHSLTLAIVLAFAILADLIIRSPEQKHAQELLDISKEHGFPHYLSLALIQRGSLLIELGQAQEGLTLMIRGLTEYRSTGALMYVTTSLAQLAQGYALLGRPVDGLNCLAEAAQIIERTEERIGEAELHRLQGDLLNAIGDRTAAEQSYRQALAVARRQSAKLFEVRAATSMARLWRDQGKRDQARELLAPVYGWFTEGFDTRDLRDAKALLDELAA
jgi:predicted ATPase